MSEAGARIVQVTDTHFSVADGVPAQWPPTITWLRDDPPDLVVHTGDIVLADPDDEADRQFAKELLDQVPVPYVVIPGNHDVGFFGEEEALPRRLTAFRATWGDDRFLLDDAGWRIVGIDTYLLGTPDHDAWLRSAVRAGRPVLVFVHQPVRGDPTDGWEMTAAARDAFEGAVDGADVRVVASGHRHCSLHAGRAVWAPSLQFSSDGIAGCDPRPGVVEHVITPDGRHRHRVIRPWGSNP